MALIAGKEAPHSCTMGHAGAFIAPGENDAVAKANALKMAGVTITNHPSRFGGEMKKLLDRGNNVNIGSRQDSSCPVG